MDDYFEKNMKEHYKQTMQHSDDVRLRVNTFGNYLFSKFVRDDQYNHERRRIEDAREDQNYYRSMNRNNNSGYSKKYKKPKYNKKKTYNKKRR